MKELGWKCWMETAPVFTYIFITFTRYMQNYTWLLFVIPVAGMCEMYFPGLLGRHGGGTVGGGKNIKGEVRFALLSFRTAIFPTLAISWPY